MSLSLIDFAGVDADNLPGGAAKMNAMFTELFGRPHGLRNKLINGCFRFWQRGTSALTPNDNVYGPDRWRLLAEANGTATLERQVTSLTTNAAAKLVATVAVANNKFGFFQPLEYEATRALRGRKMALQAALKATAGIADVRMAILEWTGTADSISGDPISAWNAAGAIPTLAAGWDYLNTPINLAVTTSFAAKSIEATIGASANNLAVLIWSEDKTTTITTDIFEIAYADLQIVEGLEDLPAFEPAPYALEYLRCARFFWKSYDIDAAPASVTSAGIIEGGIDGLNSAVHNVRIAVDLPVPMRTIPSGTFYKGSDGTPGAWANVASGLALVSVGQSRVGVEGATASGTEARIAGHLVLSAEL